MTIILTFKSDSFDTIHRAEGSLFNKVSTFESELVDATFTLQFTTPKNIVDKEDYIQIVTLTNETKNIMLNLQGDYNQQILLFLQLIKENIVSQGISFDFDQTVMYTNKVRLMSNSIKTIKIMGKKLSTILGADNEKDYAFTNGSMQFKKSCYLYLHNQLNFQCKYVQNKDDRYLLSQMPYSFGTGQTVQVSNTFQASINPFHFCSGIKVDLLNENFERIDLEGNNYFLTIQFIDKDITQKKERQLQEQQARIQKNQVIMQKKIDDIVQRLKIQERIFKELDEKKETIQTIRLQEAAQQTDPNDQDLLDELMKQIAEKDKIIEEKVDTIKFQNDEWDQMNAQNKINEQLVKLLKMQTQLLEPVVELKQIEKDRIKTQKTIAKTEKEQAKDPLSVNVDELGKLKEIKDELTKLQKKKKNDFNQMRSEEHMFTSDEIKQKIKNLERENEAVERTGANEIFLEKQRQLDELD